MRYYIVEKTKDKYFAWQNPYESESEAWDDINYCSARRFIMNVHSDDNKEYSVTDETHIKYSKTYPEMVVGLKKTKNCRYTECDHIEQGIGDEIFCEDCCEVITETDDVILCMECKIKKIKNVKNNFANRELILVILNLAAYHLESDKNIEMRSSAELCYKDACNIMAPAWENNRKTLTAQPKER